MMDSFLSLFFGKEQESTANSRSSSCSSSPHREAAAAAGFLGGVAGCGGGVEQIESMDVSYSGSSDEETSTNSSSSSSSSSSSTSSVNRKRGRCCPQRRTSACSSSSSSSRTGSACVLMIRQGSNTSTSTPVLVSSPDNNNNNNNNREGDRPTKRLRGVAGESVPLYHESSATNSSSTEEDTESFISPESMNNKNTSGDYVFAQEKKKQQPSSPLAALPEDVVAHCLSFVGGVEDRYALQCTNKQFQKISNSNEMMIGIQVGGDKQTGLHGIISETDTPETASQALEPFARAGNLEAIYMLGIIKSYCQQDVEAGICLLKMASDQGFFRASYALGLVLRDSHPDDSAKYMKNAADAGYIPALQELLPARQMKAKYGEPKADELRRHLDPLCLNRLLSRHYVRSADLRGLNTSHCWNPLCGRWAFKATVNSNGQAIRPRRHHHHHHAAHHHHLRRVSRHSAAAAAAEAGADAYDASNSSSSSTTTNSSSSNERSGTSQQQQQQLDVRVSRMKMCSRCCRAKYCSKLCQVYDWRSGRHKMECQFL